MNYSDPTGHEAADLLDIDPETLFDDPDGGIVPIENLLVPPEYFENLLNEAFGEARVKAAGEAGRKELDFIDATAKQNNLNADDVRRTLYALYSLGLSSNDLGKDWVKSAVTDPNLHEKIKIGGLIIPDLKYFQGQKNYFTGLVGGPKMALALSGVLGKEAQKEAKRILYEMGTAGKIYLTHPGLWGYGGSIAGDIIKKEPEIFLGRLSAQISVGYGLSILGGPLLAGAVGVAANAGAAYEKVKDLDSSVRNRFRSILEGVLIGE